MIWSLLARICQSNNLNDSGIKVVVLSSVFENRQSNNVERKAIVETTGKYQTRIFSAYSNQHQVSGENPRKHQNKTSSNFGASHSLAVHLIWDQEVEGSNPSAPTIHGSARGNSSTRASKQPQYFFSPDL